MSIKLLLQRCLLQFCIVVSLFFLLLSCTGNELAKDVRLFMGQDITLSLDWSAVYKGKDTVLTGFADAPVKLVVWYDSLLCGSCEVGKAAKREGIAESAIRYAINKGKLKKPLVSVR